jgi:hypothetical protein
MFPIFPLYVQNITHFPALLDLIGIHFYPCNANIDYTRNAQIAIVDCPPVCVATSNSHLMVERLQRI